MLIFRKLPTSNGTEPAPFCGGPRLHRFRERIRRPAEISRIEPSDVITRAVGGPAPSSSASRRARKPSGDKPPFTSMEPVGEFGLIRHLYSDVAGGCRRIHLVTACAFETALI
jgi:hypothetical protein